MSFINATVVPDGPKVFRVMLGKHEVGVSKTDFDARFHVNAINDALNAARDEGYRVGANFVATGKMVLEAALASGDGSESAGLREAAERLLNEVKLHREMGTASGTQFVDDIETLALAALTSHPSGAGTVSSSQLFYQDHVPSAPAISRPPTQGSALPPSRADLGGDRTDYNEPYEMAKQRVAIVERVMKLSYIKATRNTETGQERFVCRDDVITTIHDYAKATRAVAESQQSSELVEKTPSALPGERE